MEQQEIQKLQGTRLSDKPQWESYMEEMGDSKLSPELEDQIKRYEERAHHKASQAAEEELARQRELSSAAANDYRWVRAEEYEDVAPKIGRIMHSQVFLHKLKTGLNLDVWYAAHVLPGRLKLIKASGMGTREPSFVAWLQQGFMPEYSIMRFDEHHVPLDERLRGYRTVLLQMLLKKMVNEDDVDRVFGKATGPASVRYNSLLYEVRNLRLKASDSEKGYEVKE